MPPTHLDMISPPPWCRRALSSLLAAFALGVSLRAHAADPSGFPPPPTEEPAAMSSWQTTCVGRVLIDLPTDRPWTWSAQFDHAEVTRLPQPMTRQQFWALVNDTRASYAAQAHRKAPSRLAYDEKLGDNAAAMVFYDNEHSLWAPMLQRLVFLDEQHAYVLNAQSLPVRGAKPSDGLFKPYVDKYAPVLGRIHPLRPGEIPTVPGLCFDGAYVTGDTGPDSSAGVSVALTSGSRFGIGYGENTSKTTFIESAFEELERNQKRAAFGLTFLFEPEGYKQFKVLRKQLRTLDSLQGQEVITRTTRNNGAIDYDFAWGVKGATESLTEPSFGMSMTTPTSAKDPTGAAYPPLLPEPDLIAFWDRMLSRFKVLPHPLPAGQSLRAVN